MAKGKLIGMPPSRGGGGGPMVPAGMGGMGLPPDFDFDSLEVEQCQAPECTGKLFIKMYEYRKLSAVVSPVGKEGHVVIERTVCAKCGVRLGLGVGGKGGGGESKSKDKKEDRENDSSKTKL